MGGSSKKVTVGHKIYIGMHMALCHGPIDKLMGIAVNEKKAWSDVSEGGRISINKPDLFGGEEKEGGIAGEIDFCPGGSEQTANDYLVYKLGSLVPAFRRVAGVVLRQVYIGLNPYMKPWAFRCSRIHTRQNGIEQWYDETAEIGLVEPFKRPQRMLFALDVSGSMGEMTAAGKTRLQVMKENLAAVLERMKAIIAVSDVAVDIALCTIDASTTTTAISRPDAGDADIDALITWLNALSAGGGTDFTGTFDYAHTYFDTEVDVTFSERWEYRLEVLNDFENSMLIITDGIPDPVENFSTALSEGYSIINRTMPHASSNAVDVHVVNIDLEDVSYSEQMDNTISDAVPVIDGSSATALYDAIFAAILDGVPTMNPIHIIRECLTDPDWGMGEPEADIDDDNFRAAADQLFLEGFGMSILWTKQTTIEDFIYEVCRHINAVMEINSVTGLWNIRLIRDDYDAESLLVLDHSNIDSVTDFDRPAFGELVNSVTVKYWNGLTGSDASITVQDIAMIQMQGATINTKMEYPGIADPLVAERAAQRDLQSLSSPLASCTIIASRETSALRAGDVFKLTWPEYGLSETVMRVSEISYGDTKKTRIKIKCVEDSFALPQTAMRGSNTTEWVEPAAEPENLLRQMVFEAPYFELVQQMGQTTLDQELAALPEAAYLGAAAGRNNQLTIDARMHVDSGAGYEDTASLDFCATAALSADVDEMATAWTLEEYGDQSIIEAGTWAQIDDELIYLEAVGDGTLTVKRGVLDTVPAKHTAGAIIYFWDEISGADPTQYVDGDVITTKILPRTGNGILDISYATPLSIEMKGRAIRPFPPANVQINGEYFPTEFTDSIVLTWNHRDRLQQTVPELAGWTDGDIGPEEGTTYTFRLKDGTGVIVDEVTGITGKTHTYTTDGLTGGNIYTVELLSERDGYESYQSVTVPLLYDAPPPVQVSEVNSAVFVKPSAVSNSLDVSEVNSAIFVKPQ